MIIFLYSSLENMIWADPGCPCLLALPIAILEFSGKNPIMTYNPPFCKDSFVNIISVPLPAAFVAITSFFGYPA